MKNYIEKFKKAEELDDHIFEVLLPTEVVSEVKNGKKSTKVRKLYPGYVFIHMCLYGEDKKVINKPWYFVKDAGRCDRLCRRRQARRAPSVRDRRDQGPRIEAATGKEVPKVTYDGRRGSQDHRRRFRQPHRAASTKSIPPAASSRFPSPFSAGSRPVELEYWQVQRATRVKADPAVFPHHQPVLPPFSPWPRKFKVTSVSSSLPVPPIRRPRSVPRSAPKASTSWRFCKDFNAKHQGPERHDHPGRDHGLLRQELHLHPQVARRRRSCSRRPPNIAEPVRPSPTWTRSARSPRSSSSRSSRSRRPT